MTRPLAVVAAGAALLALAAACGGGADEQAHRPGAGHHFVASAPGTKDAGATGPAAPVAGAVEGGTLTVYLPGALGPDTLDPTKAWSAVGNPIQQALVSRSLTQYGQDEDGDSVLVPDLATDLGRHNDDFTEWTFTIRDDATWEDGSPVTPEEVAFGICRSLDSGAFPDGAGAQYSRTYFEGADGYEGPYTGDDPDCEDWDGISVDGQDVTIRMSRPFPDMDYWGASTAMGAVPLGEASDPATYDHRPLANGPYRVESWDPHEQLVLVRNDEWSAASDPARHQYAERWVFRFSQDQATVDEIMLSGGSRSRAALSTSVGAGSYRRADRVLGDRLVQTSTSCVATLAPDYTKITDVRVRRALAYAFPYEDAWIAAGEVPGVTREPAGSLMAPGMPGVPDTEPGPEPIAYDPGRARELLAEAGHGDEPYPLTMIFPELDPRARDAQEQVTKGLEAGGFSVKAIPVQDSPYGIWLDPGSPLNQRLNVRAANICPTWPSGSAVLPPLLHTDGIYNTAHFSEPSVDAEMERIATLPAAEQPAAWGRLDREVTERWFPVVPIAHVNRLFAFGQDVGHPNGDPATGTPDYKDLYVVR
ncbi:ABC transporter substrate-binding protein [Nocardioides zeicaulis]